MLSGLGWGWLFIWFVYTLFAGLIVFCCGSMLEGFAIGCLVPIWSGFLPVYNLKRAIIFSIKLSNLLINPLNAPNPPIIARILLTSDLVIEREKQGRE